MNIMANKIQNTLLSVFTVNICLFIINENETVHIKH
jgi:hypothetical protein